MVGEESVPETGGRTPTEKVVDEGPADPGAKTPDPAAREFEPGAGEGAGAQSGERTYADPERYGVRGNGDGLATYLAAGAAAAVVVVVAAPVEAPVAVGGAIVYGVSWLIQAL
jgi:hypothetical protein